jgi:hypothetical protein
LSARPVSNTSTDVTYEFLLSLSWTQASHFCNQTTVNNGGLVGDGGNLECRKIGIQPCSYVLTDTITPCKFFSPFLNDNWSYGEKVFRYTIPITHNYEVSYASGNWINLVGLGEPTWEIRFRLDSRIRLDTGKINSSPITKIQPLSNFNSQF